MRSMTKLTVISIVFIIIYDAYILELVNGKEVSTISKLFHGSDNDKCQLEGNDSQCKKDFEDEGNLRYRIGTPEMFGPKFQKVHLQLPRINPIRVSIISHYELSFCLILVIIITYYRRSC